MSEHPDAFLSAPAAEATDAKPTPVARRALVVGVIALIITVAGVIVFRHWPPLTSQEREHLGTWYGFIDEGRRHYGWVTELRRDKTCRVAFRHFERVDAGGEGGTQIRAEAVDVSVGTWRLDDTTYATTTRYPALDRNLWERFRTWVSLRYWPPDSTQSYRYVVQRRTSTEFIYHLPTRNVTFHAVRVPEGFELPDFPLPVDKAVDWWSSRSTPERVVTPD